MSAGEAQSAVNKPATKKSARKKLYALHTWVGFHLAAIMFLVLATGSIATRYSSAFVSRGTPTTMPAA